MKSIRLPDKNYGNGKQRTLGPIEPSCLSAFDRHQRASYLRLIWPAAGRIARYSLGLIAGLAFGQSVSQLSCETRNLNPGQAATCTITLSTPAPNGGTEVLVSSDNILLRVSPASVTVPAAATSATFTVLAGITPRTQIATVTAQALNSVFLSWTASISPNVMQYNLYRGSISGGPYTVLMAVGDVTSYTDYNVQSGQTYYYVAAAVDNTGTESAYSNEASAAVPIPEERTVTIILCVPGNGKEQVQFPQSRIPQKAGCRAQ